MTSEYVRIFPTTWAWNNTRGNLLTRRHCFCREPLLRDEQRAATCGTMLHCYPTLKQCRRKLPNAIKSNHELRIGEGLSSCFLRAATDLLLVVHRRENDSGVALPNVLRHRRAPLLRASGAREG